MEQRCCPFVTAFEQYVDPQQKLPERIVGAPANVEIGDLPLMSEVGKVTRNMGTPLVAQDACIYVAEEQAQAGTTVTSAEPESRGSWPARARKERETARREEELTQRLLSEDDRQKHEQAQKEKI